MQIVYTVTRSKKFSYNLLFFTSRISSFTSAKSQDKLLITSLERKLKNEKDNRASLETQLKELKKKPSTESPPPQRVENHDSCNARTTELEAEVTKIQSKLDEANQKMNDLKRENAEIAKQRSSDVDCDKMKKDIEFFTNALNAMQGKNLHLESSLSSETRLKLDLFSALGDTRRQLEIVQNQLKSKCTEVDILKGKIAEVMAVMPPHIHSSISGGGGGGVTGVFGNQSGDMKSGNYTNTQDAVIVTTSAAGYSQKSQITQNGVA